MKKNQKGFSALEALIIAAVLGLIGFAGWHLNSSKQQRSSQTEIYGTSTFTTQGPTDAPTGTKPASATLLVGNEPKIRSVMKPVKTEDGQIVSYNAAESDIKRSGLRILKTTEGNYRSYLEKNENVICLVQEIGEQGKPYKVGSETRVDTVVKYNLFSGCSKLNTSKPELKINIHTIGFGSNHLECLPESDCMQLSFKYD